MLKKLFITTFILFFSALFYSALAQNNQKPYLNMQIENRVFSPVAKAANGVILIPEVRNVARINKWTLSIKDEQGKEVKNFSGSRKLPDHIVWDALLNNGKAVKDGLYSYEWTLFLNAKDTLALKNTNIFIDSVSPFISISASEEIISIKDGAGGSNSAEIIFFLSCGDEGGLDFFKTVLQISDSKNKAIRTYKFEREIPDFVAWNCSDDNGAALPKGNYTVSFTAFDIAGNKSQVSLEISLLDSYGETAVENGLIQDLKQIIYFDSKKMGLKPQSIQTLQYISEILKENKKNNVLITGHTDSTKTEVNSKNLSLNRAKVVYDFLIGAGIEADRMKTEGLGSKKPLVNKKVKNANEQNRRVEIIILKTEQ
ncbi:MAG: OmpA family protein [Elusimicrobiota bacterium]|jgi:outer membrane protein OmpA-like peptidoglycan-associated protein|nr:OmpA family protein [Elusimicrobiota bacterium]